MAGGEGLEGGEVAEVEAGGAVLKPRVSVIKLFFIVANRFGKIDQILSDPIKPSNPCITFDCATSSLFLKWSTLRGSTWVSSYLIQEY